MPSLQLQGRLAYAGVGAERRRPCQLQAVIRRLSTHGQRDARDRAGKFAAAPLTRCPCAADSERRAWRAMPEGSAADPAASRLNACSIGWLMRAVGAERPCRSRAPGLPRLSDLRAAPVGMPAGHPPPNTLCSWHSQAPNALASAARAPIKSQMDARRRRPCRLHAVIRPRLR